MTMQSEQSDLSVQSDQSVQPNRPSRYDPIAQAVEVVLYAPIGAAAYLREMGPDFVRLFAARGRAEVDARQQQVAARLRNAKAIGELTIAFGVPIVRQKVGERLSSLRPASHPTPTAPPSRRRTYAPARAASTAPAPAPEGTNGQSSVEVSDAVDAVDAVDLAAAEARDLAEDRLAIPGYDALSASQVVERLAGLSGEELAAVRQYEAGNRRRRTILGKIEQLSK
jgi:hypothetical protein